jgi:hypothetical protein
MTTSNNTTGKTELNNTSVKSGTVESAVRNEVKFVEVLKTAIVQKMSEYVKVNKIDLKKVQVIQLDTVKYGILFDTMTKNNFSFLKFGAKSNNDRTDFPKKGTVLNDAYVYNQLKKMRIDFESGTVTYFSTFVMFFNVKNVNESTMNEMRKTAVQVEVKK